MVMASVDKVPRNDIKPLILLTVWRCIELKIHNCPVSLPLSVHRKQSLTHPPIFYESFLVWVALLDADLDTDFCRMFPVCGRTQKKAVHGSELNSPMTVNRARLA